MEYYITEKDGRQRKAQYIECDNCHNLFLKNIIAIKNSKHNFCSPECSRKYRQADYVELECAQCGDEFLKNTNKMNSKSGLYFCSRKCKDEAQRMGGLILPSHYGTSEYYQKKALRHYGNLCELCGYDEFPICEVHHIDGDKKNNALENLIVLCPNHHTIITFNLGKLVNRELVLN